MTIPHDRAAACAAFLEDLLEAEQDLDALDGNLAEESANEAARAAGFTEADIEAAWDIINS